tara:strand:+ start:102 stop:476 length:375 start_codon:yes stop_codon:yes gene_type:complete
MENKILKYERLYKQVKIEINSLMFVYNIYNDSLKLNGLTGITPYNIIKKKYGVYEKRLGKIYEDSFEEYKYTYILNLLSYVMKKYESKNIGVRKELKNFFEINIKKKEEKKSKVYERFEYYFFY